MISNNSNAVPHSLVSGHLRKKEIRDSKGFLSPRYETEHKVSQKSKSYVVVFKDGVFSRIEKPKEL